jgi:RHS repeat-associated protein
MVATIVQGATNMSYTYDSEHGRITQSEVNGANTTTTTYLNDPASGISSEKVVAGATTTWTDYLFAGGARVAQRSMVVGGATTLRYFITDHLGSIAVITDGGGAVLERLSYDAWGKRRNTNGTDDPAGSITSSTTRGFTDHEMIASVGLVNMNGRVYDPELGRFLSADSIVQDIFYSQAFNRYTYVFNNPLSLTDPTGNLVNPYTIVITGSWNPVVAVASVFAGFLKGIFGGLFGGKKAALIVSQFTFTPPSPPSPAAAAGNPSGLPQTAYTAPEIKITAVRWSTVAANSAPAACTLAQTGVPEIVITGSRGLAEKVALAAGAPSAGVANEILIEAKREPEVPPGYSLWPENPQEITVADSRDPLPRSGPRGLIVDLQPLYDCVGECIMAHFGLTMTGTAVTISGQQIVPYPGAAQGGGTGGTSIASTIFRKLGGAIGSIFGHRGWVWGHLAGRAFGRLVPYAGWGILAYDTYEIGKCTKECLSGGRQK